MISRAVRDGSLTMDRTLTRRSRRRRGAKVGILRGEVTDADPWRRAIALRARATLAFRGQSGEDGHDEDGPRLRARMSPSDRSAMYELFQQALALAGAERSAFVARLEREAPALGRELTELLEQDEHGGPLAAGSERASLVDVLMRELVRDGAPAADAATQRVLERLAGRTSASTRYAIRGELARGGMGAVFAGWDEDLGRTLAMKVALAQLRKVDGMTPNLEGNALARFLEEAQVTSQLDHPGIVPVHELGMDSDGRVYFTMRLVEGRDLGEVLALARGGREGWTETRALGVLLKVCEAMSYAHSKGVVHRDLKPTNVRVGRFGEVYVMDWGLARATATPDEGAQPDAAPAAAGASDSELRATWAGAILGTPGYMAPEQAAGRIEEVDERSDVYALGAMLYQLLAGRAPFSEEGEAPAPFVLLARMQAGPPAPLGAIAPSAPPELVAICEKAMSAEAQERHRDMGELGEDLRAFLEGRVVRAYETGAWAELRKWIQRNRALSASITAGFAATVAGLVVALVQGQRAEHNAELAMRNAELAARNAELAESRRAEAQAEAARAELEARSTERVVNFMVGLFESTQPSVARGVVPTSEELLDSGVRSIEADLSSDPLVRARLQEAMGRSYFAMGLLEKAGPLLEVSRDTHRERLGVEDARTLRSEAELAALHTEEGRFALAEADLRHVMESHERTLGASHVDTLTAAKNLATVLAALDRTAEAEALYERVLEALVPDSDEARLLALKARVELGVLARRAGRLDEADRIYAEAGALAREVWDDDHPGALQFRNNIASLREAQRRSEEAERLYLEALADQRRICGLVHPDTLVTLNNLAVLYRRQGRMDEAEALYAEALAASREVRGGGNPLSLVLLENLAILRNYQGRHDEAAELFEQLLEGRHALHGADHAKTLMAKFFLAETFLDQQRFEEARVLYEESLEGMRARLGARDPRTLQCMNNFAFFCAKRRDLARAAELYAEALAGRRAVLGERHPATLTALDNLARTYEQQGRTSDALDLARELVERTPADDPERPYREELLQELEGSVEAR